MTHRMAARVAELTSARVPFVHATVVRAQEPTSARPGDDAVVLARRHASRASSAASAPRSRCARRRSTPCATASRCCCACCPTAREHFPESPSARVVVNPCLSGGALEIFLEPTLPAPLLAVVGEHARSPTRCVDARPARWASSAGRARAGAGRRPVPPPSSSPRHGHGEPESIRAALDAGVPFVGLVASPRRGAAVLDSMGLTDDGAGPGPHARSGWTSVPAPPRRSRCRSWPSWCGRCGGRASPRRRPGRPPTSRRQVVDPVCGMTVVVGPDTPHLRDADGDHWFCATGCRDSYAAAHPGAVSEPVA